ncbi:myosin heavy chain, striated muscle-like [Python bivittatus]|uniref:Myosin heavy chain, striated muscle-like n=1 Tax=Python bivittatus TaxID=176946 RepID=A0A9F5N413_PYTBI|nr:myosin heavy chain, striated muscle-like [Python bivittatus]
MAAQTEGALVMRAIMKISKAEDVRKETELMMKHHANWEEYLMPGPISIAILGELACIAAEQGDFTINKAPPVRGYQYMRHPDSFHASLMQVSNSGWQAFNIAHKNMEGIRLLSLNVPEQIKMIVQTLFQEDVTLIDALLPGQLSTLKSTANECSSLAAAVEDKFNYVICLIGELLEVCTSSKSHYEKGLEETKRALEDLELRKAAAEEAKTKAEEYYNEVRNRVTETFNDYKNAVDDIPTGWNAVLLEITSSIREALTMPFIGIASLFSAEEKQSLPPSDSKSEEQLEKEDDFIALNNICAQSAQIMALGNALESLLDDEGNIDMDQLYNKKNHEIKTVWTKNKSQQLLEKITKEDKCRVKNLAMKICQKIMDISDILTQAAESGKQENKKDLKKKMKILLKTIQIFDSRSKSCTRTSPFGPVAPNMAKSQEDVQGDSTMAVKNSLLKIEQTKQMLKLSQEEYQKSFDNLKEQNKDLLDVLKEMRNRETREIDFETAKKMLIKGLEALGRVKQQWEKMVCFFQMISSLIDSCLNQRLRGFIQSAENLPQIPNYSHKDFVTDMIYKQAFNVSNIAHLVHMISDTYTEVSSKYLMDNVSSLGRLLAMQSSDPQFLTLRNDLRKSCDDAQKAIEDTVIKQRREFECSVYARVEKISSELNGVLPEVTEAERKAIEDNVQKGMREINEDEADQFV